MPTPLPSGSPRARLGQVDLKHFGDRIVYSVDVGSQEVRVEANSGIVVDIRPRD